MIQNPKHIYEYILSDQIMDEWGGAAEIIYENAKIHELNVINGISKWNVTICGNICNSVIPHQKLKEHFLCQTISDCGKAKYHIPVINNR